MKKLLYISCVHWEWIYQRPQIIADGLANNYDVTYVYQKWPFSKVKLTKDNDKMKFRWFWYFPFMEQSSFMRKLYVWFNSKYTFYDLDSFDYVYICFPTYKVFLDNFKGKLFYDCMDNHVAMANGTRHREFLLDCENDLIKKSDKVFTTAKLLQERILKATGKNAILSRNGYIRKDIEYKVKEKEIKDRYTIGYFGTIASWFDYDTLNYANEKMPNVKYKIVGPGKNRIDKEYIEYTGPVSHELLFDNIKECDCLILPFQINDVTLSVDPVKLYEYIDFGKCIISVYYPEIERFGDFAYFYHNKEEYLELLSNLSRDGFAPKYDNALREQFLKENSWDTRITNIIKEIENE